jgi:hypothetical protein
VLAKENPQRYVAFQSHAAKVQQLHGAWQQAAVQRQQQQAEQTQHYMKQQDLAFDAAIANEPAEVRERVLKAAPDVLTKAYEISREELGQAWQTQPLMRDVRVQRMMYDAVKHHLAAQGIRPVHTVPKVVRPGVAEGRATSDSITLSEKMRQFREAPTAKSGAAALQARRRAAANQR